MMMSRMRKGLLAGLTVVGMGALSLVGVAPALAGPLDGTEASPAEATITKDFQLPQGAATPAVTFTFAATPVDWDGNGTAGMPALNTAALSANYTAADTATPAGGVVSIKRETGNLFAGVTWPGAGVFEYRITENATVTTGLASGESITDSQAVYKLVVYVQNCQTTCSGTFVAGVGAYEITKDDGTAGDNTKIDPTPGGSGVGGTSALTFVNTYTKTGGGNPTRPADAALASISKTVAGSGAPAGAVFDFTITMNAPAVGIPATSYNAYVVDAATGAEVAAADNANGGNPITLTPGTGTVIKLKDGQKVVVPDAQVGATYTVSEAAANRFTPSLIVTEAGTAAPNVTGTENTALATAAPIVVTDSGVNAVDYTNTYSAVTPTGILTDILPYLIAGIVAVGALAALIITSARKNTTRA